MARTALAVEADRESHEDGVGTERGAPEAVRDDHDPLGPFVVLLREEGPATDRSHVEDGEELDGDGLAKEGLRGALAAQVPLHGVPGRERLEGGDAVVDEVRRRHRTARRALGLPERDQPLRLGTGERPQEDRAHQREQSGARPDAEGERHDHRRREARRPPEAAGRGARGRGAAPPRAGSPRPRGRPRG
jgi:hypothetical protein